MVLLPVYSVEIVLPNNVISRIKCHYKPENVELLTLTCNTSNRGARVCIVACARIAEKAARHRRDLRATVAGNPSARASSVAGRGGDGGARAVLAATTATATPDFVCIE